MGTDTTLGSRAQHDALCTMLNHCTTHFLQRSHALLTLVLSFSSLLRFAGGSLEPGSSA
jgi:hypothetical protein